MVKIDSGELPSAIGKEENLSNLQDTPPGNSNERVLRRLARDNPEMLHKIESGELTVNQAAIQAGIRKKLTPEETIVKAFSKAENQLQIAKAIVEALNVKDAAALRHWFSNQKS